MNLLTRGVDAQHRHRLARGLVALTLALSSASVSAAQDLLIRNVELVSPERAQTSHKMDVLIQDGYVQKTGRGLKAKVGTRILEADGLYLTPGLIDSHVHLYHATGLKPGLTANFDELYSSYMEQEPRSFLYFGFTSVIELNAEPGANQRFEASPVHPQLYSCGHGLVLDDGFMALEFEAGGFAKRFPHYLHVAGSTHPTPDGDDPAESFTRAVGRGAGRRRRSLHQALLRRGALVSRRSAFVPAAVPGDGRGGRSRRSRPQGSRPAACDDSGRTPHGASRGGRYRGTWALGVAGHRLRSETATGLDHRLDRR